MLNRKTKRFLKVVSIILSLSLSIQTLSPLANTTTESETVYQWLIGEELTATVASDDLFNKYADSNFETNSSEIITYNESGEVDYTYTISGSVGEASASLELCYWHNTSDLGNAPYDSAVQNGTEVFAVETNGENFMNSVYGLGIGWSLGLPQIEYISENVAYFHTGEGKAYRIGKNEEEETYELCGFPYEYTIEKNIVYENELDEEGTLQGFVGTDRYGNKSYFNLDGRFIQSEDNDGIVNQTVTYDENKQIASYSAESYTLNFVRVDEEDSIKISLNMTVTEESETEAPETEEADETPVTTTETIYTLTLTNDKLTAICEGEENAAPDVTTETDEENGVVLTTTDSDSNISSFEYEEAKSAIIRDSETNSLESSVSGMDSLLLKKITQSSSSSSIENYAAIDETNETAVDYAATQNETAENEVSNSSQIYTLSYSKGFAELGFQSASRYPRLESLSFSETESATDEETESHTTEITAEYLSEGFLGEVLTMRDDEESERLTYTYEEDEENNFSVNASYRVDFGNCSYVPFDPIFCPDGVPEYWQESAYRTTKNPKGELIEYRYKTGPNYNYEYNSKGDIIKITFSDYTINYDDSGNMQSFYIGDTALTSYQYNNTVDPELITAVAYANGQSYTNVYDDNGNLTAIVSGTEGTRYSFTYDENNNITSVTDVLGNKRTEYVETVVEEETTEETEIEESTEETTEEEPALTKTTAKVYDISGEESILMYSYDLDGDEKNITLDSVSLDFSIETEDIADENDETISRKTTSAVAISGTNWYNENTTTPSGTLTGSVVKSGETTVHSKSYQYDDKTRVTSEAFNNSETDVITYSYSGDNISAITTGGYTRTFQYDNWNELIEVADSSKTIKYSYDLRGNITSREEYASDGYTLRSTDTYSYDNPLWKDQLTAYNGQAITYDAMGNPITYNGYTYTWDMGRRLKSISNGANTYSYTYDENGLRTSKTVNGETTNFIYQDSLLKAQYTEDYSMLFWYDENCSPIGFVYTDKTAETPTNETFIYKKNALGDILGFYNSQGELIAQYWYDEWGVWFNAVWDSSEDSYTFLLNNNPLLYRGYYYDLETRYYYLQSRYYNPEWGRFLNADDVNYIGVGATSNCAGIGAYTYCENNPLSFIDDTGKFSIFGSKPLGSESNPYELSGGKRKTVKSDDYWFEYTCRGATDFEIDSPSKLKIKIYKKVWFWKDKIKSYKNKKSVDYTCSNCAINNNKTTYLIHVTKKAKRRTTTISCKVNQHVDKNNKYKSTGAVWKPKNKSAMPDTSFLCEEIWYVPAEYVPYIVDYVSSSNYGKLEEMYLDGVIELSSIAASFVPNGAYLTVAIGLFERFVGLSEAFDFKSFVLEDVKKAGKFDPSTNRYKSGVIFKKYFYCNPAQTFFYASSWNGTDTMEGCAGYTGTWKKF